MKGIYVASFPGSLSKEACQNVKKHLREVLGDDVKVLVIDDGGSLSFVQTSDDKADD